MEENNENNIMIELFNWRIGKLIALPFFKFLYLLLLILTTLIMAILEFYITKYLTYSIAVEFLLGILVFLGALIFILISRVTYEFYFAFFHIEKYLKDLSLSHNKDC